MTHKEAFEILRDTAIDIRSTREDDILTLYATAQLIALDCIEKQIPKKLNRTEVVLKTHSYIEPSCPSCGGTGAEIGTEFYGMYEESEWCLTCGQHLDWEEEDDI